MIGARAIERWRTQFANGNSETGQRRTSDYGSSDGDGSSQAVNERGSFDDARALQQVIEDVSNNLNGLPSLREGVDLVMRSALEAKRQLQHARREIDALTQSLRKERERADELDREKRTGEVGLQRALHSLQVERKGLESTKARLVEVEARNTELHRLTADQSVQIDTLKATTNDMTVESLALRMELEAAHTRNDELSRSNSEMKTKLVEVRDERDLSAGQLKVERDNAHRVQQNLKEKSDELNMVQDRLAKVQEYAAVLTGKLRRESAVAKSLRSENQAFISEREEVGIKNAAQLEAMREKQEIVNRMLADSRERYRTESQMHSDARKEIITLQQDVSGLNKSLEGVREELAELRRKNLELEQSARAARSARDDEKEAHRKTMLDLENLNEEITSLKSRYQSLEGERDEDRARHLDEVAELSASLEASADEIDRLREELAAFRGSAFEYDADLGEVMPLEPDDADSNKVVELSRTAKTSAKNGSGKDRTAD